MKNLITTISLCSILAIAGCVEQNPEPETQNTTPSRSVRMTGSDSITTGNYLGIAINSDAINVFSVLEKHRQNNLVTYMSNVNTYFADVSDLKDRIPLFESIRLDEQYDTESGVQLQLKSGRLERIHLNNRRELSQWPEKLSQKEAFQIGDDSDKLYEKMEAISKNPLFANKFQKIVLTNRTSWALYDPERAAWPWNIVYKEENGKYEEIKVHFQDKKVLAVTVKRFESAH